MFRAEIVANHPKHTQAIERAVKEVTAALMSGEEKGERDHGDKTMPNTKEIFGDCSLLIAQ